MLLLDDKTAPEGDLQLHSLAHGVIELEHVALEYGAERRRLQVPKLRGRASSAAITISASARRPRGLPAHPRQDRRDRLTGHPRQRLRRSSTLSRRRAPEGTSILITGAAGTGKSVLGTQYACAAAKRGEKRAVLPVR